MTEAVGHDVEVKPVSAAETMAQKLQQQAEINKRILEAMASSNDEADDEENEALNHLNCGICLSLCDRPVTASCQHNFCLKCFKRWINQSKTQCPTCRATFSKSLIQNPRINTMLSFRMRQKKHGTASAPKPPPIESDRPDEAFMTDKAKRAGLSNAASGRMRVTCHAHHFGPIGAEFDPERSQGVLVGECWTSRLHCRQWGSHMPHVAGIAGQSDVGAQSIVLSGGYEDDRDEGEWLLYTGSGGRDLSGNKRTNKEQSFDQVFEGSNKALLRSCERGLPVRVLRSYKEKRSAYAPTDPDWGIRYDGIYRIVAAWRHIGMQGKLVCRYLLRRCDNEPAPWSTANTGDGPWEEDLPEDAYEELEADDAIDVLRVGINSAEAEQAHWAYSSNAWGWAKPAPEAAVKKAKNVLTGLQKQKRTAERNLAACGCELCKAVLTEPVCTPCGHQFCKACLVAKFAANEPTVSAARTFRTRKAPKRCPTCSTDLAEFARDDAPLPVNHAMAAQISGFQQELRQAQESIASETEAREAAAETARAAEAGTSDGDGAGAENAPGAENGRRPAPAVHKLAPVTGGGSRSPVASDKKAVSGSVRPRASAKAPPRNARGGKKARQAPVQSSDDSKEAEGSEAAGAGSDDEMDGSGDSDSESEGEDSGDDWGRGRARAVASPAGADVARAREKLRSSSRSPEKLKAGVSGGARGRAGKGAAGGAARSTAKGRVQKKAVAGKRGAKGGRSRAVRGGCGQDSVIEGAACSGDEN
eukprot:jgi/Ulvmu1/2413/UM133_0014.1